MTEIMDPQASFASHPEEVANHRALTHDALRFARGASGIFAFSLALGVAHLSLWTPGKAVALVATPVLFAVFFAPSLWVALTLFGQELEMGDVASAASDGVAAMGAMLAGLVPAVLFFELSAGGSDGSDFAIGLEMLAFGFAGLVGLARFRRRLPKPAQGGGMIAFAFLCFALLALVFGLTHGPEAVLALHGRRP